MIFGIGVDITEISRIENAVRNNEKFLYKVFTETEIRYATSNGKIKFDSLAGMWASKEAFAKATGEGFRTFSLKDIEINHNDKGLPYIKLYRNALAFAEGARVHISISHSDTNAIAYCVLERKEV